MPEISVVVPLYNKAAYVGQCVRSILAQDGADFEIVVVDDGSTDGGARLVEAFGDARVTVVRQENRGRSAARNRGIDAARAELIALLDADDEMGPGHLAALLRLRRRYPQAGLYATGYRKSFRSGFCLEMSIRPDGRGEPALIDNYFAYAPRNIVCSSSVALPRTILRELGGFRFRKPGVKISTCGDAQPCAIRSPTTRRSSTLIIATPVRALRRRRRKSSFLSSVRRRELCKPAPSRRT